MGEELLKKWDNDGMREHNIMLIIECAYIGELSTSNFMEVLLYSKKAQKFFNISMDEPYSSIRFARA